MSFVLKSHFFLSVSSTFCVFFFIMINRIALLLHFFFGKLCLFCFYKTLMIVRCIYITLSFCVCKLMLLSKTQRRAHVFDFLIYFTIFHPNGSSDPPNRSKKKRFCRSLQREVAVTLIFFTVILSRSSGLALPAIADRCLDS